MDAFERYVRAGLELSSTPVSDVDLAIMRAADSVYGPHFRALQEANLEDEYVERDFDAGRAPVVR